MQNKKARKLLMKQNVIKSAFGLETLCILRVHLNHRYQHRVTLTIHFLEMLKHKKVPLADGQPL